MIKGEDIENGKYATYVDKEKVKQELETLRKEYYKQIDSILKQAKKSGYRFRIEGEEKSWIYVECNIVDNMNGTSYYQNEAGSWRSRTEYIETPDEEILEQIKQQRDWIDYMNSDEYKDSIKTELNKKWYHIF